MRFNRLGFELYRYYREQGDWEGIQHYVEQWGSLYGRRIILINASGVVVADSQQELLGEQCGIVLEPPAKRSNGILRSRTYFRVIVVQRDQDRITRLDAEPIPDGLGEDDLTFG